MNSTAWYKLFLPFIFLWAISSNLVGMERCPNCQKEYDPSCQSGDCPHEAVAIGGHSVQEGVFTQPPGVIGSSVTQGTDTLFLPMAGIWNSQHYGFIPFDINQFLQALSSQSVNAENRGRAWTAMAAGYASFLYRNRSEIYKPSDFSTSGQYTTIANQQGINYMTLMTSGIEVHFGDQSFQDLSDIIEAMDGANLLHDNTELPPPHEIESNLLIYKLLISYMGKRVPIHVYVIINQSGQYTLVTAGGIVTYNNSMYLTQEQAQDALMRIVSHYFSRFLLRSVVSLARVARGIVSDERVYALVANVAFIFWVIGRSSSKI